MRTLKELRSALGKAVDEMNTLIEDEAKFTEKEAEVIELRKQIERTERATAAQAALAIPVRGTDGIVVNPLLRRPLHSKLKNFTGENAVERAFRFGQFALASLFGNEKSHAWCKENGIILQRAQSEGVNSAGGFLVP